MTGKPIQLDVVSFAAPAFLDGPLRALEELGYCADIVHRPPQKSGRICQNSDLAAVVCDSDFASVRAMEVFLDRWERRKTFGILYCQDRIWKLQTLRKFTDFVTWPCHPWELEARLGRLHPAVIDAEQVDGATITKNFVGLNLIGKSPEFRKVLDNVRNLSRFDAPILIQGETGTGKELVAQALHFLSSRQNDPFIPVNCGAIPDNLFENELYGHQKGAFTDAKDTQPGLVELAEKGTLFLDEADALTPKAQVALLRFLENQEYKPLGSRRLRKANVRLITATNTDLQSVAAAGKFRTDLLFRLNVATIEVPPLRARPDDTAVLADHFLAIYSAKYNLPERGLAPELREWLVTHDWPGNVRELENFIHRAVMVSDGPVVRLPDSGGTVFTSSPERPCAEQVLYDSALTSAKTELIQGFEKRYLRRLMARTNGNITMAARLAGKERRSLGKMLKKHGIEHETYSIRFTGPDRN